MNSSMFSLDWKNIINGLIVAVGGAVCSALLQILNTPGFDVGTFSWQQVGTVALGAAISYIAKKFFSDQNGNFLGAIRS